MNYDTIGINPQHGTVVPVNNEKLYELVRNSSDRLLKDCLSIVSQSKGSSEIWNDSLPKLKSYDKTHKENI